MTQAVPAAAAPTNLKTQSASQMRKNKCVHGPSAADVQRTYRKMRTLRRKGQFAKITHIMEGLRETMSMRQIADLACVSYSSLWWTTHKPKSNAKRYVTEKEKSQITELFKRPDISLQLGWKKYANKFYVRTRLADVVATYQAEAQASGGRVLRRSTILKYRPKCVKTMGKIPYKECQCDYCVNYRLLADAAFAAGMKGVSRSATDNVLASVCAHSRPPIEVTHTQNAATNNSNAVTDAECEANGDSDTDFEDYDYDDPEWFPPSTRRNASHDQFDSDYETGDDEEDSGGEENEKEVLPVPPSTSTCSVSTTALATAHHNGIEGSGRADILDCNRACLFRNCTECGIWLLVDKLITLNQQMDWEKQVFWSNWRTVKEDGYTSFSKVRCHGTVVELLHKFALATAKHSSHLFNRFWQAQKFKQCKDNLLAGDVLMIMDFAQNLNHKLQDEPQSAHWSRKTTTVHPIVCYFRCSEPGCNEVVKEEVMMVSPDTGHDSYQVFAMENLALKYLYANSVTIKRIFQFTDNCAAQYKSRDCFDLVSSRGFPIQRNYFGAKHGKGVADGAIGRLQRDLSNATRSEQVDVMNAHDLFVFGSTRLANGEAVPGVCHHSRRRFILQENTDRSFPLNTITLVGTTKLHCVRNTGLPGCLEVRPSSCFCR